MHTEDSPQLNVIANGLAYPMPYELRTAEAKLNMKQNIQDCGEKVLFAYSYLYRE